MAARAARGASDDPRAPLPAWRLRDTPIVLLTALAEGADRIITEVALDLDRRLTDAARRDGRPHAWPAIRVVPVLPMAADVYELTFDDRREARPWFRGVLADCAERTFVMPHVSDDALLRDPGPRGEDARKLQYALAGLFIARWSRLVVALWDGESFPASDEGRAARRGGTSHVVHMALTGRVDDRETLDALDRALAVSPSARMLGAGEPLVDLQTGGPSGTRTQDQRIMSPLL